MTVLLALLLVASPARDPDYGRVLAAYTAKQWAKLDALAERFLEEEPGYEFAHSVRFMRARSLMARKRFGEAERACREYLELHEGKKYEKRIRRMLWRSLNEQWRHEEALEARRALKRFLETYPESGHVRLARDHLFRIDPGFERIEGGVVKDYDGKYTRDPRLKAVVGKLEGLRARALARIGDLLGLEIPDTFLVRLEDSGRDRSGRWAEVRTERVRGTARSVLVLRCEHLLLDSHDLAKTLVHELYHCLQRERLGERAHLRTPKWAREGAALYVAGQAEERARTLAAYVGSSSRHPDPMARLVDGLGGRHSLEDYAEDAAAFLAVEKRHGRRKAVALLRRLLETPEVQAAIDEVLGEDFATFEKRTREFARAWLAPLVEKGRERVLEARARLGNRFYEDALSALDQIPNHQSPTTVYEPVTAYDRAVVLYKLERCADALDALQSPSIRRSTLLGNASLLRLRILKALGHEGFAEAARRARLDLEPFAVYGKVLELVGGE